MTDAAYSSMQHWCTFSVTAIGVVNFMHCCASDQSLIATLTVSPTVFEILTFKARKWLVSPLLPCMTLPARGTPLNLWMKLTPQKLQGWDHRMVTISFILTSTVFSTMGGRTDRRTALSIYNWDLGTTRSMSLTQYGFSEYSSRRIYLSTSTSPQSARSVTSNCVSCAESVAHLTKNLWQR